MSSDFTQMQGGEELQRSLKLSEQRAAPPCDVAGYEARRFLGAGAYGEVWVAIDRTTGRQVAIKFYLHRGGLDWSLLSHEVEKLAFLSADRYVVQLLDVGWDSEPPYYVMEYVEQGSLDDLLGREGRLPAAQATALFREIAVGLMHSHGKGVLHCDMKPANILLDQDGKPRLADFGQSRLSHEQTPALGTLFYMAPEQADSQAMPDARWDVYALGAIFYAMLTGHPPHRHEKAVTEIESVPHLDGRLERYRRLITKAAPPTEHRKIRGVDKRLAEIIDRCLAADPRHRFPTVQAVLSALDARQRRRSLRPLVVLGALGPVLLLAVMSVFAWLWFNTSVGRTGKALTDSALQGLRFAAEGVASSVGNELETRYFDVEQAAKNTEVIHSLDVLETSADTHELLVALADPGEAKQRGNELIDQLSRSREPKKLSDKLNEFNQQMLDKNITSTSWFITDARGTQLVRLPASPNTLWKNYAYRSYFHGGPSDKPTTWRAGPDDHIQKTHLSAAYQSTSDETHHLWTVSISTPIFKTETNAKPQFLGVIAVSFTVGKEFIDLPKEARQFAALVDAREGDQMGQVLQHPLYAKLIKSSGILPKRFGSDKQFRVAAAAFTALKDGEADYFDPIGSDDEGADYRLRYLAAEAPVIVRDPSTRNDEDTGWMIIVQDPYQAAIGSTLADLQGSLLGSGLAGLVIVGAVIVGLWWFVVRMLDKPTHLPAVAAAVPARGTVETLPLRP